MQAQIVASGLYFGEGPRWHQGRLWFSDFYDHAVKTMDAAGHVTVQFTVPKQPSGLGWLPDGRVLVVSMLDRKLLVFDGETLREHADLSGVATWHCNDMVVDAAGRAYVGNFGFDLEGELATRGIAAVIARHPTAALARVEPDGAVDVAATDLHFPNGAVITPDGATLIVAETLAGVLTAFDIASDGTLSHRRTWASVAPRVPDGICLDEAGHIWFANPLAGEAVCISEGGTVLEVVETSQPCFACMLGGDDGKTLYCLTAKGPAADASRERTGKVEVARVATARAGRP